MKRLALMILSTLFVSTPLWAGDIRTERVHFQRGATSAVVEASITGYETVDYVLGARKGQSMNVSMATDNGANYFNILAPGENEVAMFNGSVAENQYEGTLPESGDYKVRVYLMRSAARRSEKANYRLEMIVSGGGQAAPTKPSEPETRTERVQFKHGETKDIVSGRLHGGESTRYLLRAREGQFLTVSLLPNDAQTHFNIFVPGGKMLYESTGAGNQYRGQLYLSGDHVVEVYDLGTDGSVSDYEVEFVIE